MVSAIDFVGAEKPHQDRMIHIVVLEAAIASDKIQVLDGIELRRNFPQDLLVAIMVNRIALKDPVSKTCFDGITSNESSAYSIF